MNFNKKSINLLPLLTEVVSQSAKKAALLQTLRQAEHKSGNWNNPYVIIVGHANYPELTQMTAGEWMYSQINEKLPERFGGGEMDYPNWVSKSNSKGPDRENDPTNATGAYQIIYKTLVGLMDGGYVSEDDIMTPEKQDELAWALVKEVPGVDWDNLPDQLTHEIVDKLARVWASLPAVISHGDCTSRYAKDKAKCFKTINEYYTKALGIEPEDVEVVVKKDVYGPKNTEDIMLSKDIMEKGDKGELVSFIQSILLNDYNIDLGEKGIDGIFQQTTHEAVLKFQRQFGLKPDGIVGPCTLDTLLEGNVRYCCKSGACKKDYCKDSDWCVWQRGMKDKLNTTEKKVDRKSDVDGCGTIVKKLPSKFEEVPGGGDNFRTNQPSLGQLAYIFEKHPEITTVVRMNAEEGTGVTVEAERECVESSGRKFVWVNAHEGYVSGEGYTQSMDKVLPYLEEGNTLIHCTAGKDRTGFMVARYLKDKGYNNWSDEELYQYTVDFNSWDRKGYICNGTAYKKYMEGFYTIKDWCNFDVENRLNKCKVCKPYR